MRKLIPLLSILIIACSNPTNKNIFEKLTVEDLKTAIEKDTSIRLDYLERLNELYEGELDSGRSSLGRHFQANPGLETETFLKLRHDLLNAERTGLRDAVRSGLVSEEAADEIVTDLASRIAALSFIRLRLIHPEPDGSD